MSASTKLTIGQIVGVVVGLFGASGHIPVASPSDITQWIVEVVTGFMGLLSLVSFFEHQFHLVKTQTSTSTMLPISQPVATQVVTE